MSNENNKCLFFGICDVGDDNIKNATGVFFPTLTDFLSYIGLARGFSIHEIEKDLNMKKRSQ